MAPVNPREPIGAVRGEAAVRRWLRRIGSRSKTERTISRSIDLAACKHARMAVAGNRSKINTFLAFGEDHDFRH
jgi:hypothetical protein